MAKFRLLPIFLARIWALKHMKEPHVLVFGLQVICKQQAHGAHFPQLPLTRCKFLLDWFNNKLT